MANALKTLFGDIAAAIKEKTGDTATMKPAEFPAKIAAIPVGGGGSAAGAVTVTFCNYDGTELYSRQVFIGDDCPDPVTQGKMPTPTRESSVQYDYTHNGWSTTEGGSANTAALKSITADKTVYAAYSSTVRKYTVRFYDGDTLMKTEQVAYGSKATPPDTAKDGTIFRYWTPNDLTIRGDTDFVGTWVVAMYTLMNNPADLKKRVSAVGFHPMNNHIAIIDGANASDQWLSVLNENGQTLEKMFSIDINGAAKEARLLYSPDGTRLVVSYKKSGNYGLLIFDTTTNPYTLLGKVNTSYNPMGMAYSPDGKKLMVGGNGKLNTFDTTQFPYVETENILNYENTSSPYEMVYNANKTVFAVRTSGYVGLYNTTTTPYTFIGSISDITNISGVSVSPDGKDVVVTLNNSGNSSANDIVIGYLYRFNGDTITKVDTVELIGSRSSTTLSSYHPDGNRLVTNGAYSKTAVVYDVPSYKVVNNFFDTAPSGATECMAYNINGSRLAFVGNYLDYGLYVYNTEVDVVG